MALLAPEAKPKTPTGQLEQPNQQAKHTYRKGNQMRFQQINQPTNQSTNKANQSTHKAIQLWRKKLTKSNSGL